MNYQLYEHTKYAVDAVPAQLPLLNGLYEHIKYAVDAVS